MRRLAWVLITGLGAQMVGGACWAQVQLQVQPIQLAGEIVFETFEKQPLQKWELSGGAQVVATEAGSALGFVAPGRAVWAITPTRELALAFRLRLGQGTATLSLCVGGEEGKAREITVGISPSEMTAGWATGNVRRTLATARVATPPNAWAAYTVLLTDIGIEIFRDGTSVLGANLERKLPAGVVAVGCVQGQGVVFDDLALGPPSTAAQMLQGGVQSATPIQLPGPAQAAVRPAAAVTNPGLIQGGGPGATKTLAANVGAGGSPVVMSSQMIALGEPLMFLKLNPDIPGDSAAATVEGWIRVLDYRYALGPPATDGFWLTPAVPTAGAASASKLPFGALTITKRVDRATPKLHLACAKGDTFNSATLVLATVIGGHIAPQLTIELNVARIVGIQMLGPGATGSEAREEVGIAFSKAKWTYHYVSETGVAQTVSATWNLASQTGQ